MRVLITGGGGFLGAWLIRRLSTHGREVRVLDTTDDRATVRDIAGAAAAAAAQWHVADVADADAVRRAVTGCDGVIHLAGVLTPACRDNPVRGAMVNLIGTLNVFAAARACGLRSVVYASSAGVFGPDDPVHPLPDTHYGAFKLACEGCARAYWLDAGLASVGLRPLIVYGPGRETGLSAGTSIACRAAARGEAYVHPFTGRTGFVYVDDCAELFERALDTPAQGARVFNVVGEEADVEDVLAALRQAVPGARLSAAGAPVRIANGIDESELDNAFPGRQKTRLAAGLAATVEHYRR